MGNSIHNNDNSLLARPERDMSLSSINSFTAPNNESNSHMSNMSNTNDLIAAMSISDSGSENERRSIDLEEEEARKLTPIEFFHQRTQQNAQQKAQQKAQQRAQQRAQLLRTPEAIEAIPIPLNQVLDPSTTIFEASVLQQNVKSSIHHYIHDTTQQNASSSSSSSGLPLSSASAPLKSMLYPSDHLTQQLPEPADDSTIPTTTAAKVKSFSVTAAHLKIKYTFDSSGKVHSYSY